jgi:hypothetical protein
MFRHIHLRLPGNLVWFAKQLGPQWASEQLVEEGLLTKELLENAPAHPSSVDVANKAAETGTAELEYNRLMVRTELRSLKNRADWLKKHGEDATLYDILYPLEEREGK